MGRCVWLEQCETDSLAQTPCQRVAVSHIWGKREPRVAFRRLRHMSPANAVPETRSGDESIQTILVVEDEVLIRLPLAEYLRDCGYRVFEASNVAEARPRPVCTGARVASSAAVHALIMVCGVGAGAVSLTS
jgi:hypothetical protein